MLPASTKIAPAAPGLTSASRELPAPVLGRGPRAGLSSFPVLPLRPRPSLLQEEALVSSWAQRSFWAWTLPTGTVGWLMSHVLPPVLPPAPLHGQPTQSCELGHQASQKEKHPITAMTTEPWSCARLCGKHATRIISLNPYTASGVCLMSVQLCR